MRTKRCGGSTREVYEPGPAQRVFPLDHPGRVQTSNLKPQTGLLATDMRILPLVPLIAAGAFAAQCFNGPHWEFEKTTYADAWNVRQLVCNGTNTCQNIGGGNYSTLVCEAQSGDVYGAYRVHSTSDVSQHCEVNTRLRDR
jgi:hypothetical protein